MENLEKIVYKPNSFITGAILFLFLLLVGVGLNFVPDSRGYLSFDIWDGFSFIFYILSFLMLFGFKINNPKESYVIQEFGTPKGSYEDIGIRWIPFWYTSTKFDMTDENFESPTIKVNDGNGTPIFASIAFIIRIVDASKCHYNLEQSVEDFVKTKVQGILRNVVKNYPYDSSEDDATTLTKSGEEICNIIENSFSKAVEKYGLEVDKVAFSELSYTPEVAASMLQKQQAQASVDAKAILTKGLCDVVSEVVITLDQKEGFALENKDKSALAKDLMIVMVSNQDASPVITVG